MKHFFFLLFAITANVCLQDTQAQTILKGIIKDGKGKCFIVINSTQT